jgi:hypothetical protein
MRHADRWVRRWWGGQLPRQVGNVRAEHTRGVWHFHWLLPYESETERHWSKLIAPDQKAVSGQAGGGVRLF